MSGDDRREELEAELVRLQGLLTTLEAVGDPAVKSAARELVQVVISLHALGLSDLMEIVNDTGSQPADTLLAKFAVNPKVRGMLLLHDLHPESLEVRARNAVERLRPHLGVQGVRADLGGVEDNIVRIVVTASGQNNQRPAAADLRREIEHTVLELTPDATDVVIEGLDSTGGSNDAFIPLSAITKRKHGNAPVSEPVAAVGK